MLIVIAADRHHHRRLCCGSDGRERDDRKVSKVWVGIDVLFPDRLGRKREQRRVERDGSVRDGTRLEAVELKQRPVDGREAHKVVIHLTLLDLCLALLHTLVVDLADLAVLLDCFTDRSAQLNSNHL